MSPAMRGAGTWYTTVCFAGSVPIPNALVDQRVAGGNAFDGIGIELACRVFALLVGAGVGRLDRVHELGRHVEWIRPSAHTRDCGRRGWDVALRSSRAACRARHTDGEEHSDTNHESFDAANGSTVPTAPFSIDGVSIR